MRNASIETENYYRSMFGHGWKDTEQDCQNARTETLIAQYLSQLKPLTQLLRLALTMLYH